MKIPLAIFFSTLPLLATNNGSAQEGESDQTPDAWSPSLDISDMPPKAPIDDSSADQWAQWDDEET